MKISDLGEFGIIDRIKEILKEEEIGDDCAHLKFCSRELLLTTDSLIEDVHFLRGYPPRALGWKSVAINVSDVVGNGGKPLWLLVSLVLPDLEISFVEDLYKGIKEACDFYNCRVVGGNISRGEKIAINTFLVGQSPKAVGRYGAVAGESLFVSGTLGDSKAGFELITMKKENYEDFERILIERHLRPEIPLSLADFLSSNAGASTDISDGLVADAFHIAKSSNVRIDIDIKMLPISEELKKFCAKYGKDPVEYALFGGEDYRLLFTCSRTPPTGVKIGVVKKGYGVYVNGHKTEPKGYTHF